MSQTLELIQDIRENLSQKASSHKDEVRVMQSMLNDTDYKVGVYGSSGRVGEYCPAEDARTMIGSVIASTTKISKDEAAVLAQDHQFSKVECESFVNVSKEFINTYAATERKLPLGGRATSNVTLQGVHADATTTRYPKKVGVNEDGSDKYESAVKSIPAHDKIKASASCPAWVRNGNV